MLKMNGQYGGFQFVNMNEAPISQVKKHCGTSIAVESCGAAPKILGLSEM